LENGAIAGSPCGGTIYYICRLAFQQLRDSLGNLLVGGLANIGQVSGTSVLEEGIEQQPGSILGFQSAELAQGCLGNGGE
jgi:hypothetical protein